MRPTVTVIGAGSWGTTLASMCSGHGSTTIWAREDEVVEGINAPPCEQRLPERI